jgi:hypothetical protein
MNPLTEEIAQEKLRELGVGTPHANVMRIVLHLKNGGKQRDIYNAPFPLASNKTVDKIKKLLDAGSLDWMTDELDRLNLLLDSMEKASDEDQQRNLQAIKGWERHKDDGHGEERHIITEETEAPLEDWGWSLSNLEGLGVPTGDALAMLQDYDALSMQRVSHTVTTEKDGEVYTYLSKFSGFEKYLRLHHLVILLNKYPNAPYPFASLAVSLYTRGVIAADEAMWTAGEDILRYEVWRKGPYPEAYYKSLKRYKRTPKRNAELRDQIKKLLGGRG